MITVEDFKRNYWDYYLQIESQFLETKRYVAFDSYNKATYSIEYLELLQAICSEIDVVAKVFAIDLGKKFKTKRPSINHWYFALQDEFDLENTTVNCYGFDKKLSVLHPWKNCRYIEKIHTRKDKSQYTSVDLDDKKSSPTWWTAYNKAKHERMNIVDHKPNFTRANQGNVLNALAGLYSLEMKYYEIIKSTNTKGFSYSRFLGFGNEPTVLLID